MQQQAGKPCAAAALRLPPVRKCLQLCLTAPAHKSLCWRSPVAPQMSRLPCLCTSGHHPQDSQASLKRPRLACSSGSLSSTTTHWAARLACSLAKASNVACSEALPAGEAVRPSSYRPGEEEQGQIGRQCAGTQVLREEKHTGAPQADKHGWNLVAGTAAHHRLSSIAEAVLQRVSPWLACFWKLACARWLDLCQARSMHAVGWSACAWWHSSSTCSVVDTLSVR